MTGFKEMKTKITASKLSAETKEICKMLITVLTEVEDGKNVRMKELSGHVKTLEELFQNWNTQ